jgi:hypothetical protein
LPVTEYPAFDVQAVSRTNQQAFFRARDGTWHYYNQIDNGRIVTETEARQAYEKQMEEQQRGPGVPIP